MPTVNKKGRRVFISGVSHDYFGRMIDSKKGVDLAGRSFVEHDGKGIGGLFARKMGKLKVGITPSMGMEANHEEEHFRELLFLDKSLGIKRNRWSSYAGLSELFFSEVNRDHYGAKKVPIVDLERSVSSIWHRNHLDMSGLRKFFFGIMSYFSQGDKTTRNTKRFLYMKKLIRNPKTRRMLILLNESFEIDSISEKVQKELNDGFYEAIYLLQTK